MTTESAFAALEFDLIAECERAMKQRDEFKATGVSTAAHGGSHDTLFGFILRKHLSHAAWLRETLIDGVWCCGRVVLPAGHDVIWDRSSCRETPLYAVAASSPAPKI
jgi:hypothetical protein